VKLYEIVLKPEGKFGTPLKGDTFFGHFMWQVVLDKSLLNIPLADALEAYLEKPFVVFSSAFPKLYANREDYFFLKRPDVPLLFFQTQDDKLDTVEVIKNRKKQKSKKYIKVKKDLKVFCKAENLLSERDICLLYKESGILENTYNYPEKIEYSFFQMHNKINRLTQTTGEGFAPFKQKVFCFLPGVELSLFVLLDEDILSLDNLLEALSRIGLMGFGCDASSGLGRFSLGEEQELALPDFSSCQGVYTLSPYVPSDKEKISKAYFQPFTRFGRHGNLLATSNNPFKNPIFMMEEGAVLLLENALGAPFVGRALTNLSKVETKTIGQGYSIVFPFYFVSGELNYES
jgi:CRISPR-associated protein Csm4